MSRTVDIAILTLEMQQLKDRLNDERQIQRQIGLRKCRDLADSLPDLVLALHDSALCIQAAVEAMEAAVGKPMVRSSLVARRIKDNDALLASLAERLKVSP